MKTFKITINGKTFDVGVEEAGGTTQVAAVAPAPKAAPAPVAKAAPAPKAAAPKAAPKAAAPVAAGAGDVTAPLAGTILSIAVKEGDTVSEGQVLLIFEAMKMENEIVAPVAGTVKKVNVQQGAVIETGTVVVSIG